MKTASAVLLCLLFLALALLSGYGISYVLYQSMVHP